MKNDQFANIAVSGINVQSKELEVVMPPVNEEGELKTERGGNFVAFPEKVKSKEVLYKELEKQRQYYAPYFMHYAPEMENLRDRTYLTQFQWRKCEKENWEKVMIPHYVGLLGVKTIYYRTNFNIQKRDGKALFLHFDGVDYITRVFVNGKFVGSHEGFFAPFEFDVTAYVTDGDNTLTVEVLNDFIQQGNVETQGGERTGGDKIYAATGLGYDEPVMGWHHCPPAMGIYQKVYLEERSRCFAQDLFIRPCVEEKCGEIWLEVYKCDPGQEDISVEYSLYGDNFESIVFEDKVYTPYTGRAIGLGDTFTEAKLIGDGLIDKPVKLYMEKGINYLKIPFEFQEFRLWSLKNPYLYQMQIRLKNKEGETIDTIQQSFGMRSFVMDTEEIPRGTFYLNGEKIRLRGANTMGHEQQCVLKGNYDQLYNDLLLAKLCNMNFLRLTQRPVQKEIYDYCDRIGLLIQTDLPLFGVLRKNQMIEALKQTQEMEKLIRSHPCTILVSYINEPFPNAFNQPHRHLNRKELMEFFECADVVVKMQNPDRVIKHVDGDYEPPSKTLPDNHCYTCWYNGHGIESGKLHKGYWIPTKKSWNFACGEFGAEGLDSLEIMKKYYPAEWLPQTEEEESTWSAGKIMGSQTGNFHYFFFDTPHTLKGWVETSQKYQAWATKWMTEAFRRNPRMVSFAIHLFIDAFPAGWMKTIMDVDRNPKPAYFAYRDALNPVLVSLRTDRYSCYEGERVPIEIWICNDLPYALEGYQCYYDVISEDGKVIVHGEKLFNMTESDSHCIGFLQAESNGTGKKMIVRAAVKDSEGNFLHTNQEEIQVYPSDMTKFCDKTVVLLHKEGTADRLIRESGCKCIGLEEAGGKAVILLDRYEDYLENQAEIDRVILEGSRVIFLELHSGEYIIAQKKVKIKDSSMLPMNFVSSKTGDELVQDFRERAFWNWYDEEADMIVPILESTIKAKGLEPILLSGNTDENGNWEHAAAAGRIRYGKGDVIICQMKLAGKIKKNPAAEIFFERLIN